MADKSTYIKLDRNIVRWRWWHDHNTLIVFLVLLIGANIQEHAFKGYKIRRGEIACSYLTLSQQANLTVQQVRTAVGHLKSTGEITSKKYNKFQVITIVNYDLYQGEITGKGTGKQQASNRQVTGNQQQLKNIKNGKNGKNNIGRSAPAPNGETNGLPKDRDDGTTEDIPEMYRDMFDCYKAYWDWRHQ